MGIPDGVTDIDEPAEQLTQSQAPFTRVAAHPRSSAKRRHTTTPDHMPSAQRRYASWTPAKIAGFAAEIGPAAAALVETIMRAKPHPEQGFRACLGILRLARTYGTVRLEAACHRGLSIGATSYGSIASILKRPRLPRGGGRRGRAPAAR